ncbi:MAG: hypothetical protein AAFN93_12230 [Bacteroidota bacterium]
MSESKKALIPNAIKAATLLFFIFIVQANGQAQTNYGYTKLFLKTNYNAIGFDETFYTKDLRSSKPMFVRTPNPLFNQSFLIHESGNAISSGFSNAQFFRPNNNPLVLGAGLAEQDSFNPYGATDAGSALVSGSINKLIGVISKGKGFGIFK